MPLTRIWIHVKILDRVGGGYESARSLSVYRLYSLVFLGERGRAVKGRSNHLPHERPSPNSAGVAWSHTRSHNGGRLADRNYNAKGGRAYKHLDDAITFIGKEFGLK